MTLPPAAAVITRLKFGGMRAAMVVLPARSWGHIAADERLYDLCRLVAPFKEGPFYDFRRGRLVHFDSKLSPGSLFTLPWCAKPPRTSSFPDQGRQWHAPVCARQSFAPAGPCSDPQVPGAEKMESREAHGRAGRETGAGDGGSKSRLRLIPTIAGRLGTALGRGIESTDQHSRHRLRKRPRRSGAARPRRS